MINFRKDYSLPSSPPSRPYSSAPTTTKHLVRVRGYLYPKPAPLETVDSGGSRTYSRAFETLPTLLFVTIKWLVENSFDGLSEIQIESRANTCELEAFINLVIRICYSWSLAPSRWLGVAREKPRILVCLGKFVRAQFYLRKGRNHTSGLRVMVERNLARLHPRVVTHCLHNSE
jgi:hypothetical protein